MTDRQHDAGDVNRDGTPPATAEARQDGLGSRTSVPRPYGAAAALADRMLVYLRPDKASVVLPCLDRRRSGMIFSGARPANGLRMLEEAGADVPRLIDPACYEKYTATCETPFLLPANQLVPQSLDDVLDAQISAGVTAALTPTGYIPAGGTDVLRAAARQFRQLGRDDAIFVAPLDVSLLDSRFIAQTTAILEDLGTPVAIIMGGQFDPLDQSKRIIPNLRALAAAVPLMAIRTDFNALDLACHGAFAGAIGTGGKLRHTVDPTEKPRSYSPKGGPRDESPSALVPELASWLRGSKVSRLFGAKPSLAPRCWCPVCNGQRLTRFLRREDQDDAIVHAVAVWSVWAADLLGSGKTLQERARYWRNFCTGAVGAHAMFRAQLQLLDEKELAPQKALEAWAALPARPMEVSPASV